MLEGFLRVRDAPPTLRFYLLIPVACAPLAGGSANALLVCEVIPASRRLHLLWICSIPSALGGQIFRGIRSIPFTSGGQNLVGIGGRPLSHGHAIDNAFAFRGAHDGRTNDSTDL